MGPAALDNFLRHTSVSSNDANTTIERQEMNTATHIALHLVFCLTHCFAHMLSVHRYTLSRALLSSFFPLRRTCDALRALKHFYGSRSVWQIPSRHHLADLPCLLATACNYHYHDLSSLHLVSSSLIQSDISHCARTYATCLAV